MKETDPIIIEWKRLLDFVRRYGLPRAAEHIISLIKTGDYPLYYSQRFIELTLRLKEFEIAGRVIKAIDDMGVSNPLIDKLKGAHLWGLGRHDDAVAFSIKAAERWLAPYIYYQASKFLAMKGKQDKADHYFEIAKALAKKEEEIRQQKS